MNHKQQVVLWMGISLIIIRLLTTSQGKVLWNVITGGNGGGPDNGFIIRQIPHNQTHNPYANGAVGGPLVPSKSVGV